MSIVTFIAWYMLTGIGYMIGHLVFMCDTTGDKYSSGFSGLFLNAITFPINIIFFFIVLILLGISSLQRKEKA